MLLDTASGWTPLLRSASLGGNRDIADLLVKFQADVRNFFNLRKHFFSISNCY